MTHGGARDATDATIPVLFSAAKSIVAGSSLEAVVYFLM
jgi:hypothetical protein